MCLCLKQLSPLYQCHANELVVTQFSVGWATVFPRARVSNFHRPLLRVPIPRENASSCLFLLFSSSFSLSSSYCFFFMIYLLLSSFYLLFIFFFFFFFFIFFFFFLFDFFFFFFFFFSGSSSSSSSSSQGLRCSFSEENRASHTEWELS